jgi:hypothetical protein
MRLLIRDYQGLDKQIPQKIVGVLNSTQICKSFLQGPSARSTGELLKLNRYQLWWVTGLLTGHCHLKGHLSK